MDPEAAGFLMLENCRFTVVSALRSVPVPSRVMVMILLLTSKVTEVPPSKLSLTRAVAAPLLMAKPLGRMITIFPSLGKALSSLKETSTLPTALARRDWGCTSVSVSVPMTVCVKENVSLMVAVEGLPELVAFWAVSPKVDTEMRGDPRLKESPKVDAEVRGNPRLKESLRVGSEVRGKPRSEKSPRVDVEVRGNPKLKESPSVVVEVLGRPKPKESPSVVVEVLGRPNPKESPSVDVEVRGNPKSKESPSVVVEVLGRPKPKESPRVAVEALPKPAAF